MYNLYRAHNTQEKELEKIEKFELGVDGLTIDNNVNVNKLNN